MPSNSSMDPVWSSDDRTGPRVPGQDSSSATLDILLVEDNPNNQMVAKGLLAQRGHRVEVAANGRLALAALKDRRFDLVLMDIQMPVMDGVEATLAIRAGTEGIDPDLPIIALTAHAMQGDRERYLKAGMNDYITKPIDRDVLFATIDGVQTGQSNAAPQKAAGTDTRLDPAPIEGLLELEAGGFFSLKEYIELFIEDTGRRVKALQAALAADNAADLRLEAHTIKGSARELGALQLSQLAERLEEAGTAGDLSGCGEDAEGLAAEFAAVRALLQTKYL